MSIGDKLTPIAESFTLKDHTFAVLRAAILDMDIYSPNADLRLDERKLADKLGISRTPIREALARLAQEDLVQIIPRKGVFVCRKTRQEILEMIITWAALESMAARLRMHAGAYAFGASFYGLAAPLTLAAAPTRTWCRARTGNR